MGVLRGETTHDVSLIDMRASRFRGNSPFRTARDVVPLRTMAGQPKLSPDDFVFLLETDRQSWLAVNTTDESGLQSKFRLAFTSLERAQEFAAAHREMRAARVREIRLRDITTAEDPPLAVDLDPGSV